MPTYLTTSLLRAGHDLTRKARLVSIHVVVDDTLDDAGVVAQVDECQVLTVFTATPDPAAHADRVADVGLAEFTTEVGTHGSCLARRRVGHVSCCFRV